MNALRWSAALSMGIGVAGTVFLACGGSDVSIPDQDDGGNGADGSVDARSSGEAGGSFADASDAGDGAADGGGTFLSDPGKLRCGTDTCDVPGETCCLDGDAGSCVEGNGGLGACGFSDTRVRCDETADCADDDVCCVTLEFDGFGESRRFAGFGGAECRANCNGIVIIRTDRQVCKTGAECGDAGACQPVRCGGRSMGVCGGLRLDAGAACE